MKKFSTLLIMAMVFTASFAAPPIKIAYLGSADPAGAGDTIMPLLLTDMGFDVTYHQISSTNPVPDHDVVVISETIGSGDAGWATYSNTPSPVITFKVHATKSAALNWVPTGAGTTGVDYDNSVDSVIKFITKTHPILAGFTGDDVQVLDEAWRSGANVGWVNLGTATAGVTIVAQSGTTDATHQGIVAIEEGTAMNATVTLTKRAVIIGYHQACWSLINDNGIKTIEQAIFWAAKRVTSISDNVSVETSVYPNPSTGLVNLKFGQAVNDLSVNIFSIDGKVVFSTELSNIQNTQLNLSDLNSGIYFIRFEGDFSYTEKLILN